VSYNADMAEAEQWLVDWQSRITDGAEHTREMAARIAAVKVSTHSPDGAVKITVDSAGVPVGLTLSPAVERWPAQRIADEIIATMRRAQTDLTHRVEAVAADTVGAGSEIARTLLTPYHERFTPVRDQDGAERR
jgi:hypothetical protein